MCDGRKFQAVGKLVTKKTQIAKFRSDDIIPYIKGFFVVSPEDNVLKIV